MHTKALKYILSMIKSRSMEIQTSFLEFIFSCRKVFFKLRLMKQISGSWESRSFIYFGISRRVCSVFSICTKSVLQMSLLIIPKFLSPTKGWLMNYLFYGSGLYPGFHMNFSCHRLCLLQTKKLPLLAGFSLNLPAILKNTFTSKLYRCRSHLNTGKSAARMSLISNHGGK